MTGCTGAAQGACRCASTSVRRPRLTFALPDATALEITLAGPTLRAETELGCVVYGAPFGLVGDRHPQPLPAAHRQHGQRKAQPLQGVRGDSGFDVDGRRMPRALPGDTSTAVAARGYRSRAAGESAAGGEGSSLDAGHSKS